MKIQLTARSISQPVQELLQRRPSFTRVLAIFPHACNLVTSQGDVVALVVPSAGNGPLNIVVEEPDHAPLQEPSGFLGRSLALEADTPVHLKGEYLHVGRLEIDLRDAQPWEPCPNWEALRAQRKQIAARIEELQEIAVDYAPDESMLALLFAPGGPFEDDSATLVTTAWPGMRALQDGWPEGIAHLEEAAICLAGLGGGLTPAGDDFLFGAILGAWLFHPVPEFFGQILVRIAAPRTTTLAAAFLRAAAAGQCSADWHRLLEVLTEGGELSAPVQEVLAHGATSGGDALAGFLWVGAFGAAQ